MELTREEAWKLLTEYNQDAFHLKHAQIVEGVMRYFARELGYGEQEEFWGIVGLLHDLDFERYPEQHCIKEQEIMRERGIDASVKECVRSGAVKNWGMEFWKWRSQQEKNQEIRNFRKLRNWWSREKRHR